MNISTDKLVFRIAQDYRREETGNVFNKEESKLRQNRGSLQIVA